MDRSDKLQEKFDAADVFHRTRMDQDDQYRAEPQESDPDTMWDGRDEQDSEKPMYDSRSGS